MRLKESASAQTPEQRAQPQRTAPPIRRAVRPGLRHEGQALGAGPAGISAVEAPQRGQSRVSENVHWKHQGQRTACSAALQ